MSRGVAAAAAAFPSVPLDRPVAETRLFLFFISQNENSDSHILDMQTELGADQAGIKV